jgi:hypothetical protein
MIEQEGASPLNGGLVSGVPPHAVGAAESPDCVNTDPADPWGMTTRNPSAFYTGPTFAASSQNSGMTTGDIAINPLNGRVYVRGASILMWALEDGGFSSIPGSGVSLATRMGVAILNQPASVGSAMLTLVVTDVTIPILFNETTVAVSNASMASTGMNCEWAEIFANRAFVGGRRDGWFENYVSHSALFDVTDWTTANNAGAFQVAGADRVTQGKATRNVLYFFKRNSVHALTGTGPLDFQVETVTENIGLIAPRGVASDGQGVYFASDDGIYYLNGLNLSRVSDKIRQDYLDIPDKTKIAFTYRGEKLYVFRNSSGTNPNDAALVAAPRRKLETGETQAFWTKWASQPFGAAAVGGRFANLVAVTVSSTFYVFALDVPANATQPSAPSAVPSITMTYNTPDMDFRWPDAEKKLVRWTTHHKPTNATQTWTYQWYGNGASVGSQGSFQVGTAGTHQGVNLPAEPGVNGDFLRLKLSCVGQVTLYGYEAYAEPQVSEDFPRV